MTLNYRRVTTLATLLCVGFLSGSSSASIIYFPNSVEELILDILLSNSDRENNIIDLRGHKFVIEKINNTGYNGGNGLPVIQPDMAVITPHSITIKNGTIEIDLLSASPTRHFEIAAGATLILENVKLKYGESGADGGFIFNSGTVSTDHVAFIGNTAYGDGGAIFNNCSGILNIGSTTFNLNTAFANESTTSRFRVSAVTGGGGALYNSGAIYYLFNSTFANNSTSGNGGAINNISGTINSMTNNTVALNTALLFGGGIYSSFTLTGMDIYNFVSNIVAANSAAGGYDIYAGTSNINNAEYNLIGITGTGSGNSITSAGNNVVGTVDAPLDPQLEQLRDNGGYVWTMALSERSIAINAGYNPLSLRFDERGPGFEREGDGVTDIGAYELQAHRAHKDE